MYPFHDENYFMQSIQPYPYHQRPPARFYLQKTLNTTLKGIQIVNQIIPIVYQIKPLIDNTRNGLAIIKAMKNIDDIDVDEVEAQLQPIQREDEEIFQNML